MVSSEGERLVSSNKDSSSAQSAREAVEAVHTWHGFRPGRNEATDDAFMYIEFVPC